MDRVLYYDNVILGCHGNRCLLLVFMYIISNAWFLLLKCFKEEVAGAAKGKRAHRVMLTRLLALAGHALAEVTLIKAATCSLHILNWPYIAHTCMLRYVFGNDIMCNANYLGRDQA